MIKQVFGDGNCVGCVVVPAELCDAVSEFEVGLFHRAAEACVVDAVKTLGEYGVAFCFCGVFWEAFDEVAVEVHGEGVLFAVE